ncbi:recombinase family protein [Hydrogenophaga sp. 2FB]|uniref:recombinase family protein n=1 Tax=Hydrogenophaga sp. 2FB TaxID=2502187 RepID=UPI0010F9412D|nr:recombinase family protein [Hydrogenophaga sp. 2FB]
MNTVYYLRVSTKDQTIASQRTALGITDDTPQDTVFMDEGVSGAVDALDRPGFAACARYCRKGDILRVTALDRLGRNAIDVQRTFAALVSKGVVVDVMGMGVIAGEVGSLLVTILSGVAQMERARIAQRTEAGRETARHLLAQGKRTQNGKASLGRPVGRVAGGVQVTPQEVAEWRRKNDATIQATADHWKLSTATVKRYSRDG